MAQVWLIPSIMATLLSVVAGGSGTALQMESGLTVSVLASFGAAAAVNAGLRVERRKRVLRRSLRLQSRLSAVWAGVSIWWLVLVVGSILFAR